MLVVKIIAAIALPFLIWQMMALACAASAVWRAGPNGHKYLYSVHGPPRTRFSIRSTSKGIVINA